MRVGEHWGCRAGQNWLIIRTDGTLAPCFPMYNATCDWGTVEKQKFDLQQLDEMKQGCEPDCFSTLGYNVAYRYDVARVTKWLLKQAERGRMVLARACLRSTNRFRKCERIGVRTTCVPGRSRSIQRA